MSSADLPSFHDGPVSHTHQQCNNCFRVQRSHGLELSRCSACMSVMYCSRDCQRADWPKHKGDCNVLQKERLLIEEKTRLPSAMLDFHEWVAYYNMPLQNCAIAAMELPQRPHMEEDTIFCIRMRHKRDPTLPVWDKFEVINISREPVEDIRYRAGAELPLDATLYAQACAKGRVEMGTNFYGVIRYAFLVHFEDRRVIHASKLRHFAITKETARAQSLRDDWWVLLREYISTGTKMRFGCGHVKLLGFEDICCCGGWVHDPEQRQAFSNIGA